MTTTSFPVSRFTIAPAPETGIWRPVPSSTGEYTDAGIAFRAAVVKNQEQSPGVPTPPSRRQLDRKERQEAGL